MKFSELVRLLERSGFELVEEFAFPPEYVTTQRSPPQAGDIGVWGGVVLLFGFWVLILSICLGFGV